MHAGHLFPPTWFHFCCLANLWHKVLGKWTHCCIMETSFCKCVGACHSFSYFHVCWYTSLHSLICGIVAHHSMLPADLFLCGSVTVLKKATALFTVVVFIFNHSVEMKKFALYKCINAQSCCEWASTVQRQKKQQHRNTGSLGPYLTWVWWHTLCCCSVYWSLSLARPIVPSS